MLKVRFCYPHFTNEEIHFQGGEGSCPRSHTHQQENGRHGNQTVMCLTSTLTFIQQ